MKYDIENLVKTFERHSIKMEIERAKIEQPPWIDCPEDADFCFSTAMYAICKEIKALKSKLSENG